MKNKHMVLGYIIRDMLNLCLFDYRKLYFDAMTEFLDTVGYGGDAALIIAEQLFLDWWRDKWTERDAVIRSFLVRSDVADLSHLVFYNNKEAGVWAQLPTDAAKYEFYCQQHDAGQLAICKKMRQEFQNVINQITIKL